MLPKKSKKIGLLTQPLHNNYGGLLQAYALQTVLKNMGHDVIIINRNYSPPTIKDIFKSKLKRFLVKNIPIIQNITINPNQNEQKIIGQHTIYFKNKYIHPITKEINKNEDMDRINCMGFDAYVVGSDQVWRPRYSPNITNYFLDFAKDDAKTKRVSYAASFGVDNWEFSHKETIICHNLAKMFDAVSVREASGINLCEKHLKINALQVLDPTMLLNYKDYINLIKAEGLIKNDGTLMTYVLDKSDKKEKLIADIAKKLHLIPFTVMQKQKLTGKSKLDDCVFPPLFQWLRGFMDAKFVITDSFHGCVFAILFNKPFLALGNSRRGIARFRSLLGTFKLEDRLLLDDFNIDKSLLDNIIDWDSVNYILKNERKKSFNFLKNSLN